ncbi:putative UDP-glucuronosyltransferase ugt-58 [Microplitis mediator]|uniref:putative UDP-glucuronosyltransferase ugt-58 n=1 Tax=Microplitis mediator TaxID=375433 RepID=UPI00255344CF|nr:putative UDP-glucuronosyltransferase ugt-58 [Microplitis mediator]
MIINYVLLSTAILSVQASILASPPQTALIIGFENVYDLSLLANTISDQGIDVTLVIPALNSRDIYEHLVQVEVIKLNFTTGSNDKREEKALKACETFLSDKNVIKRVGEIQPTFTIFPAIRHDACLIPWAKSIESIPVIWALGQEDEYYAVEKSRMAIPFQTAKFFDRFLINLNLKSISSYAQNNYVNQALKLIKTYIKNFQDTKLDDLYSDVKVFLWGGDPILRVNFAPLTHQLIEIGCHHCRGVQPLPPVLQKELIEFKLGTIVVTLDSEFIDLIEQLAQEIPQGRQGQAIVWKSKIVKKTNKKNVFINADVDRQDLIGYSRTRILFSHCADTELLEAKFHGTPVICFPRNSQEKNNNLRAIELGISIPLNNDYTIENVYKTFYEINENVKYREVARKVSLAIRDKLAPASDRLIFSLSYAARNKETMIDYWPVGRDINISTFTEDVNFLYGLIIGITVGALFVATTVLTWYYQSKDNKLTKVKGKKYNR